MAETKIKWAFAFKGPARAGKSYAAEVVKAYFSVGDPAERVEIIAFADVLKRICAVFLGWDETKALADQSKSLPVAEIAFTEDSFQAAAALLCARTYDPAALVEEFGMDMAAIATKIGASIEKITVCPDPAVPTVRAFADQTTYGRMLQLMGTEGMRAHISTKVFSTYVLAEARRRGVTVLICPDARFDEEIEMVHEINGFAARIVPGDGFAGLSDGRSTTHASENALDRFGLPVIVNNFDPAFVSAVRAWAQTSVVSAVGKNE